MQERTDRPGSTRGTPPDPIPDPCGVVRVQATGVRLETQKEHTHFDLV